RVLALARAGGARAGAGARADPQSCSGGISRPPRPRRKKNETTPPQQVTRPGAGRRPARRGRVRGDRRRRGWQRQRLTRQREEQARQSVLEAVRKVRAAGGTQIEAARKLGVSARTLRRWARRTGELVPRGRPVKRPPVEERQEVIEQVVQS